MEMNLCADDILMAQLKGIRDQLKSPLVRQSAPFILSLLLNLPLYAIGQELTAVDQWKVEAVFLRNFTRYVTWPKSAFSDEHSPWRICVLGRDPFGDVLERTFAGRTEQGRSFSILRTNKPSGLRQCQIVYVAFQASMSRRSVLAELNDLPVLTVSNAPDFLHEGGIIRFEVRDYVEMSIDLDHARAASLSIQAKMLEVSRNVINKGQDSQ